MRSVVNESGFNVSDGKFLVKFWAPWCTPCRLIDGTIRDLDLKFEDIEFISVDIEQVPSLARKFKIKTLPSVLLIEDNEEVKRISGVQDLRMDKMTKELNIYLGIEHEKFGEVKSITHSEKNIVQAM